MANVESAGGGRQQTVAVLNHLIHMRKEECEALQLLVDKIDWEALTLEEETKLWSLVTSKFYHR
jgi:hypothetical protein